MSPPLPGPACRKGPRALPCCCLIPKGALLLVCRHMMVFGISASVMGFAEGELSQPSDKFVGGKSTMEKAAYFGPGTPPNTDWHHYTWTLVATDLDPKRCSPV
jgi:phosphatidylethanolamine-binding protein (PEBP) family uncharacterized protein